MRFPGKKNSQISLNFVPVDLNPIDNKSSLVRVMALSPNRRQVITWTNNYFAHWLSFTSLAWSNHLQNSMFIVHKNVCQLDFDVVDLPDIADQYNVLLHMYDSLSTHYPITGNLWVF